MDNVKKKILDLFDFALNNPDNKKQIIDIFIINELLAKKIEKSTQLFVEKYHVSIDNYSILHTLNKHGNEITEQERGQIAVIKNDFTLIQDIIENSNSIELSEKKFQSKNVIIFKKNIYNDYIVRMECRKVTYSKKNKKNRLILLTMFIRKK